MTFKNTFRLWLIRLLVWYVFLRLGFSYFYCHLLFNFSGQYIWACYYFILNTAFAWSLIIEKLFIAFLSLIFNFLCFNNNYTIFIDEYFLRLFFECSYHPFLFFCKINHTCLISPYISP